ncbi:MAG: gfo/Idh/MocA family oxidoreductase, partial [Mucilaginibacter sp.]
MEENGQTKEKNTISRGDFIKKAAIATAGFYIVPRYVLGGKGYTPPSDKLYIAAVGCSGEAEND